jgi:SAM-dependent methyltransferase
MTEIIRVYLLNNTIMRVLREIIKLHGKFDLGKIDWLKNISISKESKILDVGCGSGKLLLILHYLGFKNLTGADPFISKNIFYENGVKVFKERAEDIKGRYDLIMLHHSFEHMPNPIDVMSHLSEQMRDDGILLIRIPVAQSYAWRKYKTNWVQLDAPRHFFLYSVAGMRILAEKTGFKIDKIIFDSFSFQFWGSEQYEKSIPLMYGKSYKNSFRNSIFSLKDICRYKIESDDCNNNKNGDQACFVLKKIRK